MKIAPKFFLLTGVLMVGTISGGITYGQPPSPLDLPSLSSHESKILMTVHLQPHENQFLAEQGYYQVSSFQLMVNNSQDLCPTGNCEYTLEDGEFRTNSFTGGYTLEGKLKATVTEGDTKNSKFFLLNGDLEKVGSEETPSQLTEFLEGDIGLGGTAFDPDIEYDVVNGTFSEGELVLPGSYEWFGGGP